MRRRSRCFNPLKFQKPKSSRAKETGKETHENETINWPSKWLENGAESQVRHRDSARVSEGGLNSPRATLPG